ncbi:response regulator [candidate division KSB1 bacterium]|nr:response regulator [candidate division KSB1 bacterium]
MEEITGKILVVDDDEYICKLCAQSLSNVGYGVQTTCNPNDAFAIANDNHFDLLLTDVKMPQMSGIELMQRLKKEIPELPVVLMTGYATLDFAIKAVKGGAYNFIHKPFNVNEIIVAVGNAIERRRLFQENIRLKTLVNLFEVSKEIGNTLEISRLFELILSSAILETGAEKGAIFDIDEDDHDLYARYTVGFEQETADKLYIPRGESLIGYAYTQKKAVFHIKNSTQPDYNIHLNEQQWGSSIIAVPMKNNHRILGVLALYKKHQGQFKDSDLDIAAILANQTAIALSNAELILDLEILFLEAMKALASALDAKDPYTHGHSHRVSVIGCAIAKIMKVSDKQLENLELAGILHDIGKIGINDDILQKPTRLIPQEYDIIKMHTVKGYNILKHIKRLSSVVEAVYTHHEWYNGKGYPRGLAGDEIPLEGAFFQWLMHSIQFLRTVRIARGKAMKKLWKS